QHGEEFRVSRAHLAPGFHRFLFDLRPGFSSYGGRVEMLEISVHARQRLLCPCERFGRWNEAGNCVEAHSVPSFIAVFLRREIACPAEASPFGSTRVTMRSTAP